jgi:hypothetical protein
LKTARALVPLVSLALILGLMPSATAATSQVDCGPDDGRDRLTPNGYSLEFDAPAMTAPELAATHDVTGDVITPWRSAPFAFTADLAPSKTASAKIRLDWTDSADYDIFVYDAEGSEIGRSDTSNIDAQVIGEEVVLEIMHCDRFTVVVKSWAGRPDERLKLAISVTPSAQLLSCVAGDTAPGCAGKQPGQAPDPVADTRTRLYLGGDPGQISMLHAYQNNGAPFHGTLATARPTGGTPNSHTRALVGFHDQYQNPLVPHFSVDFAEPRTIKGNVPLVFWASSPTLDATGTLYAILFGDGEALRTVPIKGDSVTKDPTRVAVTFEGIDAPALERLTLQIATRPVATSGGQVNNPRDALVTVHYGCVQFPSRLTLP